VQLLAFWRRAQLSEAGKSLVERTSDGASEVSAPPVRLLGRMWGVEILARLVDKLECLTRSARRSTKEHEERSDGFFWELQMTGGGGH
jgi:hypothetical protein